MTQIPQLEDYLVLIGDNNRNSFVGAGFIVEALQNYFVITATHVVADSLYIAREKLIDPPNEIVNVYFPKTRKWMISSEIKSLSPVFADDIAILRLHDQPQNSVPAVLGTAETLTDFTFVTAGSRLAGTRANGIVLGVELISRIKDKHPRFELLSSQIDRGMSGGPIVHSESNLVVGMTVSTWYSGNSKDQSTSYAATSKTIATNLNGLVIFGIEDGEYKLFDLAFKLVNSYESHDPERHSLFGLKGEFFVDMPLWEYGYEYVDETTIQFAWLPAKEKEVERKKGMIAESAIDYLVDWAQTPDKPYLTLLAEFGMGKSTILYRLEYILSKKYLLNYKMCPIRISLGQNQYLERSNISLLAKIKEAIKHEHGIEFFNKELKHLLNSRKLILLLDSFDEMSPELKPGIRMTNLDLILNDLKSANVKVIIASRDNYFYSNKDIEEVFQNLDPFFERINFYITYLRGFRPTEIQKYLQLHLKERADELLSEIKLIPDLLDLARRPILLTMITVLEEGIITQKITSRKELYDQFVRVWLKRERFNGRLKMDERKIKSVLLALAKSASLIPEASFSQETVNDLLMKKFNFSIMEAEYYGADFKVCCFLGRDIDDNYKFLHNSFREYFYALWLFQELENGNLGVLRSSFISVGVAYFLLEELKKNQDFLFQLQRVIASEKGADYLLTNSMMLYELLSKDETKTRKFYESIPQNQVKPKNHSLNQRGFDDHFVIIPSGVFLMGSWKGRPDETPVHIVEINSFALNRYAVTNLEFHEFIQDTGYITLAERFGNSRIWTGGRWKFLKSVNWKNPRNDGISLEERWNHPVVQIAWEDALAYCEWKSKQLNGVIELPTENEWEYACRARSQSNWCFGNDETLLQDYAWYKKNLDQKYYTQPVGLKKPNSWGLYDMHGNVREWCISVYDRYPGNNLNWDLDNRYYSTSSRKYHVLRGGHFGSTAQFLRSAIRVSGKEGMSADYTGFRIKAKIEGLVIE